MPKVNIPNGVEAVNAVYREQLVEDYKGNPLIEALPDIYTKEEVIDRLAYYPPYSDEERNLDGHYRYHLIQRLFQYFQPLNIHIDLESRICRLIRQGYLARNPVRPQYAENLQIGYQMIKNQNMELISNQIFRTTSYGFTIVGVSGMGKTTAINRILSLLPQIIVHSQYKEMDFSLFQLVWLELDCPHDGSVKGLCVDFFMKVDSLLGTNYYKKFGNGRLSVNTMLPVIAQIARNCSLGILIIDEIQHLSTAKSGGSERMLNFFVTLINTIGVPVILIGTNKAMSILQSEFRQARRGSGQGDMVWERMKQDESWEILIEGMWDYQWVKKPTPLTQELKDVLYEESQGITDIAVKLYAMTQIRAIATGKEEITPSLIRYVAKENLKLVRPMLDALRTGNINKIVEFGDICSLDIDEFMGGQLNQINLNEKIKEAQKLKKKINANNENIKEQAVLKLLDLDIEPKKAKRFVELVLENNSGVIDVKEIVKKAFALIIESETEASVNKRKERTLIKFSESDLRYIIEEGKKKQISAYEALKNSGYIKPYNSDLQRIG
ncbi:MAG: AAA family ATPase [Epulopiscium sp.]|nr:AAA family ATPase [Candidatus Epulonipiscium sp.]